MGRVFYLWSRLHNSCSQYVLHALFASFHQYHHSGLMEIRMLTRFIEVYFSWINRRQNYEAEPLAKRGVSVHEMYRSDSIPSSFLDNYWRSWSFYFWGLCFLLWLVDIAFQSLALVRTLSQSEYYLSSFELLGPVSTVSILFYLVLSWLACPCGVGSFFLVYILVNNVLGLMIAFSGSGHHKSGTFIGLLVSFRGWLAYLEFSCFNGERVWILILFRSMIVDYVLLGRLHSAVREKIGQNGWGISALNFWGNLLLQLYEPVLS